LTNGRKKLVKEREVGVWGIEHRAKSMEHGGKI